MSEGLLMRRMSSVAKKTPYINNAEQTQMKYASVRGRACLRPTALIFKETPLVTSKACESRNGRGPNDVYINNQVSLFLTKSSI